MPNIFPIRESRPGEAAVFKTEDGKLLVAVSHLYGGSYRAFISRLKFDEEEAVFYWSNDSQPCTGICGTIEEAASEAALKVGPLRALERP